MSDFNRRKPLAIIGLLFLLSLILPPSLSAQSLSVRGKVLDRDGKALPGVVVYIWVLQ